MYQVLAPTDGQVLTYDTVNGWQPEDSQGGEEYTISEISTNTTAQVNFLYVLTANLTLTLPATPSVGDRVALSNMSGTTTPTVARNGNLIAGLAEDLTIDVLNLSVEFIYSGASQGWIIFVDSILGTSGGGGSVDGNGTTNYISKWSDANTLTDSVIFDNGTNVGIGTSSPASAGSGRVALHLNSASGAGITFSKTGQANSYIYTAEADGEALAYYTDGEHLFYTVGSERMRIDSSGNVGIGTSSPDAQLTISRGLTSAYSIKMKRGNRTAQGIYTDGAGISLRAEDATNGDTSVRLGGDNVDSNDYDHISFTVENAERGRFTANGLTFNGDTAAANALDDYEEGTWTPSFVFTNAGTSSFSYALATGTYTKIGRLVCASFALTASITKGTASGDLTIAGFPIMPAGVTDMQTGYIGFQNLLSTDIIGLLHLAGTATVYIGKQSGGTLQAAAVTDGIDRQIRGTFIYYV
jgi:hypothetical protein